MTRTVSVVLASVVGAPGIPALRRRPHLGAIAIPSLLILFLVAACGNAAAPGSSGPAPTSAGLPSPSGRPASDNPDAGSGALARLADPTSTVRATISGTLEIDRLATVDGSYEQDGRDFRVSLDTKVAGISFNIEQRVVDDQSYMSLPGRPWRLDPAVSGKNRAPTLSDALRSVRAVPDGTTTIAGAVVGRYKLDGLELRRLTAALGLSDPGVKLTDTDTSFFASAEGEPVALDLRYTVLAADGAPGTSDLRLTFQSRPGQVAIASPDDPWLAKTDGHGYAIWYPATWRADLQTADGGFTDTFAGPDASVTVFCVRDSKVDLKQWAADGVEFYAERFGAKPDRSQDSSVGTTPVRVSTWKSATVDGEKRSITNVALLQGTTACDIQWFAAAGLAGTDDDRFETFLTTFALE